MRRTHLLLATSFALLLSACAPSTPQSLIVGTWEIESGMKTTWQFRKDGTGSLTMFGKSFEGRYRFNGLDELELTAAGGDTAKYRVSLTENELVVTYQNQVTRFRRRE